MRYARGDGTVVAVVLPGHTVHLAKIAVGRDYGDRLEVLGGLQEGDTIIANPAMWCGKACRCSRCRSRGKGPRPR